MKATDKFSFNHYLKTLEHYKKADYKITRFKDHYLPETINSEKYIILRHDVDQDLELAFKLAKAEHSIGVNATYFIRLHARAYNLFSIPNIKTVHEMLKMGHEIGFHFEPGVASYLDMDPLSYGLNQLSAFQNLLGHKVDGLSTHEPARADNPNLVETLVKESQLKYHAYQPSFFSEIKYISDSGARWREGCFSEWINKAPKLQVLTHPIWWYPNLTQENY